MGHLRICTLVAQSLWELLRYDLLRAIGGFGLVRHSLRKPARQSLSAHIADEAEICAAMSWAVCFYPRPVKCLQRSVAMARLLRRRCLDAKVVVGCRPDPFFSHAWVEIGGRVILDSPSYKTRLPALMQL